MAQQENKLDGSQQGHAEALHACPHAATHLKLHSLSDKEKEIVCQAFSGKPSCSKCQSTEIWICGQCGGFFCGRFANKHMLEHREATGHSIAVNTGDLSFWCYECESYLHHLTIASVLASYVMLHVAKFGERPPNVPAQVPFEKKNDSNEAPSSSSSSSSSGKAPAPASDDNKWMVDGLPESALQNPVVDKILGCIYGNALGDAVGLSTEFMEKSDVEQLYPNPEENIPFPNYKKSMHSSRWLSGDWTDDTDQMILIMDTIVETKGEPKEELFAKKLRNWIHNGFPELGDKGGMGLGMTVGMVVQSPEFLDNPHLAAKKVWVQLNKNAAPNGAVMRTSVLGCFQYNQISKVIENTEKFAKVTHFDPRCRASCIAVTTAIALMIQGEKTGTKEELEALIGKAQKYALDVNMLEEYKNEFLEHINAKSLQDLRLDERGKIGYTYKCFGSGFYALRSNADFKRVITEVTREAGDADTNCAVCGALVGTKIGYSNLPRDWLVAMPHKRWLDRKVVALLKLMGLVESPQ